MFRLALTSLWKRKAASAGAFVALLCAAAMVCACGVLLETGVRGSVAPERYSGVPVVVTADQQIHWSEVKHKKGKTSTKTKSKELAERAWLPPSIEARLAAVPGARVIPERTFAAELIGPGGASLSESTGTSLLGHNWSSAAMTPYRLTTGTAPDGPDEVVVDQDLAASAKLHVGDRVGVASTSSPRAYVISGVAAAPASVRSNSAVFFADDEARQLAAHGTAVTAFGVLGAEPAQARAALRGTTAQVSTGAERGTAEFRDAASARSTLTSLGGAIGGASLIVAILVVVGTFTLSTQQRRRGLALLRAVGATPRQVRRILRYEALALALTAGILGALIGLVLARVLRGQLVSSGVLPDNLHLAYSPLPALVAVAATTIAGVAASLVSARRTTRVRPIEALTDSAVERRAMGHGRTIAGLIAVTVAALVTAVLTQLHSEPAAIPVTYLTVLLWMIVIALFGPAITRVGVALLSGLLMMSPVGGFLAAKGSRSNSRRVASTITPLALLIGMTTTILFVPTTVNSAAADQVDRGLTADYVVGSRGLGVPGTAVDELRSTPGVRTVTQVVTSRLWIGRDRQSTQGVSPGGLTTVLDPQVVSGSLARLGTGGIAMSSLAAQGRHVGDTVPVVLGDGTARTLRLVAVYERGLGFGDTLVSFDDLVGHVDNPIATTVYIRGSIDPKRVQSALDGFAGIQITGRSGYQKMLSDQRNSNAGAAMVLLGLIIAFAAIAVVNTLAVATMARSRDVSLLRLIGATARQVWGSLRWELAIIMLIATALGSAAAWCTLTAFSVGMVDRLAPVVVPATYAVVVVGAAVLAAPAMFLPAQALLRRRAVDELAARSQ